MGVCNTCNKELPLEKFAKDKSKKAGIRGRCKECQAAYWRSWRASNPEVARASAKAWKDRNPEKVAASGRKRYYGIDNAQFLAMGEAQSWKCEICKISITDNACVDHDHETNQIRSLLCRRCNSGLGMFSDDQETLQRAANYLKLWRQNGAQRAI